MIMNSESVNSGDGAFAFTCHLIASPSRFNIENMQYNQTAGISENYTLILGETIKRPFFEEAALHG